MNEQLNAMVPILTTQINDAIATKFESLKGVEAHKMAAVAQKLGIEVDGMTEEVEGQLQDMAAEGMAPAAQMAMRILQTDFPEKYKEENPMLSQIWQLGKLQAGKVLQQTGQPLSTQKAVTTVKSGIFG